MKFLVHVLVHNIHNLQIFGTSMASVLCSFETAIYIINLGARNYTSKAATLYCLGLGSCGLPTIHNHLSISLVPSLSTFAIFLTFELTRDEPSYILVVNLVHTGFYPAS